MNYLRAFKLLKKIGFVRTGGSQEEKKAANILLEEIRELGGDVKIEEFNVQDQDIKTARLEVLSPQQKQYSVTAYGCSGSTPQEGISAPFYYMESGSPVDIVKAKGKIVLVNGYLNYALFKNINEAKACGFIAYSGDVSRDTLANSDLDIRELRAAIHEEFGKIPGVHLRTRDALKLVKSTPEEVRITIIQEEKTVTSQNVIATIKGSEFPEEIIVVTAHYDSVPFSSGVYDNGAGSVIIMELYRHFLANTPKRTIKFIWCGSEERGLLGAKAYVKMHFDEIKNIKLCINVDVGGAVLGKELAIITGDISLKHYVDYLSKVNGFPLEVTQDIYSSDSIPFADSGVPGINFARFGSPGAAHIHSRYDTFDFLSPKALEKTGIIVELFADTIINSVAFPVPKDIPSEIMTKVDKYLNKKDKK